MAAAQDRVGVGLDHYSDGWIEVWYPSVRARTQQDGWNVDGQLAVDGWSGATPRSAVDAVSGATLLAERRGSASLKLLRTPQEGVAWGGGGAVSVERDYLGRSVFLTGQREAFARMVTLSGTLGAMRDENGRRPGEPASAINAELGWAQVLSRRDSLGLTLSGSQWWCGPTLGCQASPWRHTLWEAEPGATFLVPERHPDRRGRLAASARLSHAFGPRLALHLTQRAYADTWWVRGGTTWLTLASSLADDRLLLRFEGRFTAQQGAPFYAPVHAELGAWRSTDRELGGLWGGQGGVRAAWTIDTLPRTSGLTISAHVGRAAWFYDDYPALPERRAWLVGGGLDVAL